MESWELQLSIINTTTTIPFERISERESLPLLAEQSNHNHNHKKKSHCYIFELWYSNVSNQLFIYFLFIHLFCNSLFIYLFERALKYIQKQLTLPVGVYIIGSVA